MEMETLLPDTLKTLWEAVEEERFTGEQFYSEQERLLDEYRCTWRDALILHGYQDLRDSLLSELGEFVRCDDRAELESRCTISWKSVEDEWHEKVDPQNSRTIQKFYDRTEAYLYNLTWWHALIEDETPLAYVTALHFGRQRGCRRYLDFGAGISSGGILFARHGFEVTSADISSSLLQFSRWRFEKRAIAARLIDLKERPMPEQSADMITAMDVCEHLVDPAGAVDQIADALAPGGYFYGRFDCAPDDERPQHIVRNFEPMFERLRQLGFAKVWEDEWLWGHQVFQKPERPNSAARVRSVHDPEPSTHYPKLDIRSSKRRWEDLAIFGGAPQFAERVYVGRPNIGNRDRFLTRVDDVISRRWLSNNGPCVQDFERRIADLLGVRNCVAVVNGTVGLEIAARTLGLTGEVIVPSFTFIATAHALRWLGITPVFCDVAPQTHNIDPTQIEPLITSRTTGIMGVHLWGRPCEVDRLEALAARYGLALLFDAAHAFACSAAGTMIGNFGQLEVFSFHATKVLHTFEGGAIVTNNEALAQRLRAMRAFALSGREEAIGVGTNGKMNEVCAAMGLTGLESLEEFVAANYLNYKRYQSDLEDIPGVKLSLFDEHQKCNYHYIVVEIDESVTHLGRDQALAILEAENVVARRYFYPGCHRMEPYRSDSPEAFWRLPVTDTLARRVLILPTGTAIGPEQVSGVCEILRLAVAHGAEVSERLTKLRREDECREQDIRTCQTACAAR
jgi:dTDP-4-amino-4,6-dideoxygalactose transaminase/SAM-dependent methyltransferase